MKVSHVAIAVAIVILVMASIGLNSNALLDGVQSGEIGLYCNLESGFQKISPEKVVDFYADKGYWKFVNGGSSSCQVVR